MSEEHVNHSGEINMNFKVPPPILAHLKSIRENELFLAIITDSYMALNAQCAMELGTALLSNRKIGFLIKTGTVVPNKVLQVADEVVFFDKDEDLKAKGDVIYNLLYGDKDA